MAKGQSEAKKLVAVDEFTGKFMINEAYRPIAEQLIKKYPELHVPADCILFLDNIDSKGMNKGRQVMAKISKVSAKWEEIIYQLSGQHFDYVIEFYKKNTDQLSKEQLVAVIYHELRHVDEEGKIISHDIEDWPEMFYNLGPKWATTKAIIPDLLSEDVDWSKIKPPTLFDEPNLKVVK